MSTRTAWAAFGLAGGLGLLAAFAGGCYLGLSQADVLGDGGGGAVHDTGSVSSGGGQGGDSQGGAGAASVGGGASGGAGGFGGSVAVGGFGGGSGGGGGVVTTVVPDFGLLDVNASSTTFNQLVSPRDYLAQVSAWYFGHST